MIANGQNFNLLKIDTFSFDAQSFIIAIFIRSHSYFLFSNWIVNLKIWTSSCFLAALFWNGIMWEKTTSKRDKFWSCIFFSLLHLNAWMKSELIRSRSFHFRICDKRWKQEWIFKQVISTTGWHYSFFFSLIICMRSIFYLIFNQKHRSTLDECFIRGFIKKKSEIIKCVCLKEFINSLKLKIHKQSKRKKTCVWFYYWMISSDYNWHNLNNAVNWSEFTKCDFFIK